MNKRKIIIIIISVIICIGLIGAYAATGNSVTAETLSVQKREIKQYVEDTASVKCREKQTVYVEGSGKVTGVRFDSGDTVKKGDLLLTMDVSDFEMQLKDANAKISASQSQIDSTKISNYANKIEIATAAVEQAQIANDSALRNSQSSKVLYEAGAISREDFNKAQDASKAAQAALKAAKLELDEIKKGAPDYVKKGYSSQLEQSLIFRDSIQKNIDKQKVLSPMDGVVLEKLLEENSTVVAGTPGFVIGNIKTLELEANILSDDSYKVKFGDEVEISSKALGDTVVKGKVSKIAPIAKTIASNLGVNQKRVQITIDLPGGYGLLKPGYNVDIKIVTAQKKDVIAVPDSAVFDYKGNSCVFVIANDKTAIRQVRKGLEGDKLIEITEGLNEGDIILTKPDNNTKEGLKIKAANNITP